MGFIGKLVDDIVLSVTIETLPNQPLVDHTICDALKTCIGTYSTGLTTGNIDKYKAASYNIRSVMKEAK